MITCRILVFARAPLPGQVKSRLARALGAAPAAALYHRMARACLHTAVAVRQCRTELWCAPDTNHPFLQGCGADYGIELYTQSAGDLGQRMERAGADALGRADRVLLIGTDCPTLAVADLERADHWLKDGCDAVLGPAEDGGYVLLGLRRAEAALFHTMPWGTSSVLPETRRRLAALGWRWAELAPHWDVDRPRDVVRLASCPGWEDLAQPKDSVV